MQLKKRHRRAQSPRTYNRHCWYCGKGLVRGTATRDHQVPVAHGGNSLNGNIVWACEPCNRRKAARSVESYRDFLSSKKGVRIIFFGER